ncbi:MAG: hypothetical protein CM15mP103_04330 [Gammaproteobacteria bacterium]|nr:MAG: hypothetical protein CM15mP103_04330 [Gammaproteobacteria bacterium]
MYNCSFSEGVNGYTAQIAATWNKWADENDAF